MHISECQSSSCYHDKLFEIRLNIFLISTFLNQIILTVYVQLVKFSPSYQGINFLKLRFNSHWH